METDENKANVIPATGCKETSLKEATTIPELMKQSIKTLGFNFSD